MDVAYAIAGLVVGFAVGLTGVGGGALMTPLLHLGFGIPLATAVGTDLLYAAATKLSGVWVHGRSGTVDWRVVRRLCLGSLPAALVTVYVLDAVDLDGARLEAVILPVLSAALFFTASVLLFRGRIRRLATHEAQFPRLYALHRRLRPGATVLVGTVIGVLVTLTSVGAGVLGTTAILLLYPGFGAVRVVGTELAHAVPLTFVAGLGHMHLGTVDYGLLGALLVGSLPGVYLGSRLGARISDRVLRPVLAGMLVFIGWRLAFAM